MELKLGDIVKTLPNNYLSKVIGFYSNFVVLYSPHSNLILTKFVASEWNASLDYVGEPYWLLPKTSVEKVCKRKYHV